MAIIDFISSDKINKDSAANVRSISKVRLKREPKLYYTKEKKGRSGRGLGRFHEITELFFDSDNRLFVGYKTKDESDHFYQYAIIGKLLTAAEEEEAE
jgi:hypothetical protein